MRAAEKPKGAEMVGGLCGENEGLVNIFREETQHVVMSKNVYLSIR